MCSEYVQKLRGQCNNANIGTLERLEKIDQKLSLFKNDVLCVAIYNYVYDILAKSHLIQVKVSF